MWEQARSMRLAAELQSAVAEMLRFVGLWHRLAAVLHVLPRPPLIPGGVPGMVPGYRLSAAPPALPGASSVTPGCLLL